MPYKTISQLPESVKESLPSDAEKIFLEAFNASYEESGEEAAFQTAWAAVKNAGYSKNKAGKWIKSDSEDDSVNRYDAVTISAKPKRTAQGFLKVSANVSRAGVFIYSNPDGSKRRELRLPEEIFKEESLSSLEGAPITFGHPVDTAGHVMVNPKNIKKFSVGVLGDNVRNDDKFISADLTIMDESAIEAVEKGHRREVSLGYTCDLDFTPGIWNGEQYDAIQRNIVYNHAAIVQRGRAGHEVAIRMDSSDAITEYADELTLTPKESKMENLNIHVDGIDLELPKSTAQVVQAAFAKREEELSALKAELESTKGQFDALKEDLAKAEKARCDAEDPSKLQAAVQARVELVSKASKVLGEDTDFVSLTDRQVKEAVISKISPDAKFDSLSDDYINGRFDHILETYKNKQESLANARKVAETATKSSNKPEASDIRKAKLDLYANAWKKTLKG